jgi:hypothetical protein
MPPAAAIALLHLPLQPVEGRVQAKPVLRVYGFDVRGLAL